MATVSDPSKGNYVRYNGEVAQVRRNATPHAWKPSCLLSNQNA